jgi:hypothetical protein
VIGIRRLVTVVASAALITSLLVFVAAPTAHAWTSVIPVGNIPVGGTSTGTATFTFTENSFAAFTGPGSLMVTVLDYSGGDTMTLSGGTVIGTGSLAPSLSMGSHTFTVTTFSSDPANVEQFTVSGIAISASASAAPGPVQATMSGSLAGPVAQGGLLALAAPGTVTGPPSNDEWTGAWDLSLNMPIREYASEATTTPGSSCYRPSNTVWFKFTPPLDSFLVADTSRSPSFPGVGLAVFSATDETLSRVYCYGNPGVLATTTFLAKAGTTYYFELGNPWYPGWFTPTIELRALPTAIGTTSVAPNARGWWHEDVTVTISGSDLDGHGIAALDYYAWGQQALPTTTTNEPSATLLITAEGMTGVMYRATDGAGQVGPYAGTTLWIDKTAPIITWRWNYGTYELADFVSITCLVWDGVPGYYSNTIASSWCSPEVRGFGYQIGVGEYTLTANATDLAGNSASSTTTFRVVERVPPEIIYSDNAGVYAVNEPVAITCTATDNHQLVWADCVDITGPAWAFGLGTHTYSASARDWSGNTGSGSTSFDVIVTYPSLSSLTSEWVTKDGVTTGLLGMLNAAARAEARGNVKAEANILEEYRSLLLAQSGKSIAEESAQTLVDLSYGL